MKGRSATRAGERLSAGLVKNGVSIAIDRQYVGGKSVTLNLDELTRFTDHLWQLRKRLVERAA